MNRSIRNITALLVATACSVAAVSSRAEAPPKAIYYNDFEKLDEGDVPGEMLILIGAFKIKTVDNNKLLDLPGDPLDGFGLIFGPADAMAASARIYGTSTGKRSPEFGIGIGDAAGYRLWVMPAINEVQILKGDEIVARAPLQWKSGTWTQLKLQARKLPDGSEQVEGKAWQSGENEPKGWAVTVKITEPVSGRASVWGSPYASTPIRFDDLAITLPQE